MSPSAALRRGLAVIEPRATLLPLAILTLVLLMVVPIPPFLLDIFFTLNLASR